jgi:hypothetical protein
MPILQIITLIKDILLGLAAITTACVAIIGLNKWKREIKGKADFEAAQSLIQATYKLRDAISICRSSFIGGSEFPEGYTFGASCAHSPEVHGQAYAHVYQKRWEPVLRAIQDFDTFTLEAEALWGVRIRSKTDELCQRIAELRGSIEAVIGDKASGGEDFRTDPKFGEEMRSIVSGSGSEKDEFWQRIKKAIVDIEKEVRPHLKRN